MLADVIVKVAGMEKEGRHEYYPRPSLAGPERCIRQFVYWGNGTPEDKEMQDRFVLVLDDSSWHEHLTVDWIQKTAFQIHSQQMKVECSLPGHAITLTGSIDGIVTDMLGVDRLWEHKAINHFTWQRYASGNAPLDYITQCCIYIRGLQKENPSINEALLLIKNKNTAQYLEYQIGYDSATDTAVIKNIVVSWGETAGIGEVFEGILEFAFSKFGAIQMHIDNKTLPSRPYEYGTDFPCGYCSWETTCWANYIKEVEELAANEADLQDIKDMVDYYVELGNQASEIKKTRDDMQGKLKKIMTNRNARAGRSGEYMILWTAKPTVKLKLKEDMPKHLLPEITRESVDDRFTVKKIKAKKG